MPECQAREALTAQYLALTAERQEAQKQLDDPNLAGARPEILRRIVRIRVYELAKRRELVEHCRQHGC